MGSASFIAVKWDIDRKKRARLAQENEQRRLEMEERMRRERGGE